ncbi:unnamed protein product [Rangifer tarandus platyrhynchus]|uniref:Uncharacterized protein n=2 Tax=Rangifer tarandus platyrhynchus TaxID=3082113 RepID=A0AC59YE62_RANTA|nr:unnamed protein product [Rangifer tarandus platyrhynchus]
MSCYIVCIVKSTKDELARTIPVKPSIENKKIKLKVHNVADGYLISPPWKFASQLNTSNPVGTAVIRVADVIHSHMSICFYCEHMLSSYVKAWEDITLQTITVYSRGSCFPE